MEVKIFPLRFMFTLIPLKIFSLIHSRVLISKNQEKLGGGRGYNWMYFLLVDVSTRVTIWGGEGVVLL